MSRSPLIKNGALSLTANGDLQDDLDIVTQMTVTVGAYNCIYDPNVDSGVIPYLFSIPVGGFRQNTLTYIITSAFQSFITNNVISDLTIAILAQVLSEVSIRITAVDLEGNQISLTWTNPN
jgi:hypothetical protein